MFVPRMICGCDGFVPDFLLRIVLFVFCFFLFIFSCFCALFNFVFPDLFLSLGFVLFFQVPVDHAVVLRERGVEVRMEFGGTEIAVSCYKQHDGDKLLDAKVLNACCVLCRTCGALCALLERLTFQPCDLEISAEEKKRKKKKVFRSPSNSYDRRLTNDCCIYHVPIAL